MSSITVTINVGCPVSGDSDNSAGHAPPERIAIATKVALLADVNVDLAGEKSRKFSYVGGTILGPRKFQTS
jgi:hypothetical protein